MGMAPPPQAPRGNAGQAVGKPGFRIGSKDKRTLVSSATTCVVCTLILLIIDATAKFDGFTLGEANYLCNSGLGQLAQGFSSTVSVKCGEVSALMDLHDLLKFVAWGSFAVAVIMAVGLAVLRRRSAA
jgi:hypothetical protein